MKKSRNELQIANLSVAEIDRNSLQSADLSLAKLDDETLARFKSSKVNVLPLVPKESWDLLQKHYGTSNVIETENNSFEERDVSSE